MFGLAFFSYILLTLYANYFDRGLREIIYSRGFEPSMVFLGLAFALLFFAAFAMGYLSGLELPTPIICFLFLVLSFYESPMAPVVAALLLIAYCLRLNVLKRFPDVALLLALFVPLLLYFYYGVPLYDRSLRYTLVGPLVLLALLAATGMAYSGVSFRTKTLFLLAYTVVFYASTFRSLVLLVYITYSLSIYLTHPSLKKELGYLGMAFALVVLWMSGGLHALLIRVGFTFLVFNNLVKLSIPWGLFHGTLLLSDNPRHLVAQLFNASMNYTYFFFGQAVADFGIFGVVEAFLLGALLRDSEKTPEAFTLVLSVFIYSLDPGIDALVLLFTLAALLFQRTLANV